ncbi:efflux RND transporter periplasmic adaptor subunit [Geothrix sp. 21YS21S-4]|uniref:efflux RND transporter periplasmic adaptor subunit n=1 Tax=Geothrix sp. 21YS21S-4 TaxID=3068889 RepID=UPI0027B8D265|nr:efflux RND transporter periplasmic adaptor subunit [Geothrix sp. 21YS21S-4]
MRIRAASLVLVLGAASLLAATYALKRSPAPAWRTVQVDRGAVAQHIKASGTLNALIQVSVGTQVSGVVTALYADFNSLVKKGQIIALIDPTVSEAQLSGAKAAVLKAQAAYDNAKADLARYRALGEAKLVSASDLDARVSAFQSAQGVLDAARAECVKAEINLAYCTIRAPVDGVVVSRVVDVGQTVAASFSTPSLFVIAQDLSQMQLKAAIDEADIGQVEAGQSVAFTVSSFPDRTFEGRVREVQLNPTTSNNVVTYTVVMDVANVPRAGTSRGDYILYPGMTAHVDITTARRTDVLRVPNLALRFDPGTVQGTVAALGQERLWLAENGSLRPVAVTAGLSDGQFTEVSGSDLREGMAVATGVQPSAKDTKAASAAASPLGPKGPGGPPPP